MNTLHAAVNDALQISREEVEEAQAGGRVGHKLNELDLPIELWIEILSYLPPGFVRNLIGVNRYLFEQGMDEIYEEIQVTTCDRAGLKAFEQLSYQSIACRVRRLRIQPDFLPVLGGKESKVWNQLEARENEIRTFLEAILEALPSCSQLRGLTVVLRNQHIPESFSVFLTNFFERLGSQLHRLTIDTTCSSFVPVRDTFLGRLPSLISLAVNMACSPLDGRPEVFQACHALTELITDTRKTLRSVALSESAGFSFAHVFRKLYHLPFLDSLEIQARYGFDTLTPGTHLWSVIENSSSTLGRLAIKQSPLTNPEYRDSSIRLLFVPLFSLSLSNLQELVLQLEHRAILPKFTQLIPTFAPHLRRLSLPGRFACLTYEELQSLLRRLSDGGGQLEHLKISVTMFSLDVLQLLYEALSKLKVLGLYYEKLGKQDSGEVSGEAQLLLYDAFRARQYPGWEVRELKLMGLHRGRPDNRLISAVAESLPSLTRVVRSLGEEI